MKRKHSMKTLAILSALFLTCGFAAGAKADSFNHPILTKTPSIIINSTNVPYYASSPYYSNHIVYSNYHSGREQMEMARLLELQAYQQRMLLEQMRADNYRHHKYDNRDNYRNEKTFCLRILK